MMPSNRKCASSKTATKSSVDGICKSELALLDLYSGCGGMSTGLCIGAKACGLDLVAVVNKFFQLSEIQVVEIVFLFNGQG